MYVTGGHNNVKPRLLTAGEVAKHALALPAYTRDAVEGLSGQSVEQGMHGGRRLQGQLHKVELTTSHAFSYCLGVEPGFEHGIRQEKAGTTRQTPCRGNCINDYIGQRYLLGVNTVNAKQADDSALDGDCCMLIDKDLYILSYSPGRRPSCIYFLLIEVEFCGQWDTSLCACTNSLARSIKCAGSPKSWATPSASWGRAWPGGTGCNR